MSYRDPGAVVAVARPAQRRRSLGFYFAIAFGVLAFVVLVCLGLYIGKMAEALKTPIDKKAVLKSMAGIPVIEDAVFDDIQTKIQMRVVLPTIRGVYPSDQASVVAYRTFTPAEGVMNWYDQSMALRNYTVHNEADEVTAPTVTFQHRYNRDNEVVLVQAQHAANKEETTLVIVRFTGYKGKL